MTAASAQRASIVAALTGASAICWIFLYVLARRMADGGMSGMDDMAGMAMPMAPAHWSTADFAMNFVMWWAMMIAMMLPSAAPMVLTFASINQRKRERGQPFVPAAMFTAGYLIAWGAFSIAATLAQWGFDRAALLSPQVQRVTPLAGGLILLAVGVYQFTPLKHACLAKCRSPFAFLINQWRDGRGGALRMGWTHGAYCLGCCWLLMALLFVGGAMNLLWVAAIAALVFVEKLLPAGALIARIGGAAMFAFGVYLLTRAA